MEEGIPKLQTMIKKLLQSNGLLSCAKLETKILPHLPEERRMKYEEFVKEAHSKAGMNEITFEVCS